MLATSRFPSRRGLTDVEAARVISGTVVLVALPPRAIKAESLATLGARDTLVLLRDGPAMPVRGADSVRLRYRQLSDVRKSNCRVALLHGRTAFALADKAKIGRFSHVLIPAGPLELSAAAIGLARYGRRGGLALTGRTRLVLDGRERTYLVFEVNLPPRDNRRQYGPAGLEPVDILRRIADLDQVVLRWSENIEAGRHDGDVDILISGAHAPALVERFSERVATYPLDVYTDDGSGGFTYKGVPYLMPDAARKVIASGMVNPSGIRVADATWRLVSYAYHLLFHNKSERVQPGTQHITRETFQSPHYHDELVRLAGLAGRPVPRLFDDLEGMLKEAKAFPSLDLIGFYSRKNAFLKQRYFDEKGPGPGLATFFIRDFGQGLDVLPRVRESVLRHFEILAEGVVTGERRSAVLHGVRGGNWTDPQAPGGVAEPVYWLVCWDPAPKEPSLAMRRKHPRLDNEHVRIKDLIRSEIGAGERKVRPVVHSSDNALEALDHLDHLGLADHPVVRAKLSGHH